MQKFFNRLRRDFWGVLRLPKFPDVGDVQERRTFQPDFHKCALHARQHARHPTQINVADNAAMARALNVQLFDHAVIKHRHARFLSRDIDEDFLSH